MPVIMAHDNHCHTRYCGHSGHTLPLTAYRDAAAERGISRDVLAETDVAIEYNTSGLRRPLGRPIILPAHLAAAVEREIPVIVGSDAHSPDEIGLGFDRVGADLRAAGLRETHRFVGGRLVVADRLA